MPPPKNPKAPLLDPDTSETIDHIRIWHRQQGLDKPWSRDRFHRLCRLLSCTQEELANLVCVYSRTQLSGWLKRDAIPPYIALQLQFLENAFMQVKYGAVSEPLLPLHLIVK